MGGPLEKLQTFIPFFSLPSLVLLEAFPFCIIFLGFLVFLFLLLFLTASVQTNPLNSKDQQSFFLNVSWDGGIFIESHFHISGFLIFRSGFLIILLTDFAQTSASNMQCLSSAIH